jgi:hypothetical protein
MKKLILLFLFINACFASLLAQHLNPIQEAVVRKTMSAQFGDVDKTRAFNLGKDVFCVVGNDTLYNPDGYNYVYKLHHDTIERLDCSLYHGSNHRRFLFAHNGELCALGGYGFFTTNNNLQVFNPNVKEWLFKPTTGDVPDFINGLSFKIGDDIYNMSNFKSGNNTAPNLFDSTIYKLNLKTMVWERFYQLGYPNKITGFASYTKQFCLIIGDFQTIIVKPSEFKFLLLDNNVFGYAPNNHVDSINSDNLFFRAITSSTEIYQYYKINLNTTWKKHAGKVKSFNLKPIEKVNSQGFNAWFFVSLVLLITIIVGYFVMKRSPAKQNTIEMDVLHPDMTNEASIQTDLVDEKEQEIEQDQEAPEFLYTTLLNCEKTFLSSDELDELFGISHLEPDSKKQKRHRFLAELNINHPGFIIKSKDQTDKRRFNYKIVK